MNVSTGEGSNDQHPDHDVALGEALIKDICETWLPPKPLLRACLVLPIHAWYSPCMLVTRKEHVSLRG